MNWDERHEMREDAKHKELRCDVCQKWVDEMDITIIEGLQVCGCCDDLASLRIQGFIRQANEMTKELVL